MMNGRTHLPESESSESEVVVSQKGFGGWLREAVMKLQATATAAAMETTAINWVKSAFDDGREFKDGSTGKRVWQDEEGLGLFLFLVLELEAIRKSKLKEENCSKGRQLEVQLYKSISNGFTWEVVFCGQCVNSISF